MSLPALDNLVRIGQLKAEPSNPAETHRMLTMARTRLEDAQLPGLSQQGRFTSAYNAAHAAALAALRWYGYRSENRYTVFHNALRTHWVGLPPAGACWMPPTRNQHRYRIDHLYQDPHETGRKFILHHGDLTDSSSLIRIIQQVWPNEIYNLAAQSHVAVSLEEPEYTANSDALGALRWKLFYILSLLFRRASHASRTTI